MKGTILITGAAQRVGKAIALHLAKQGFAIALHYHRSQAQARALADEIQAMGVRAMLMQADFGKGFDAAQADALFAHIGEPVHGLINNAAVFSRDGLGACTASSFDEHMRTNLLAPLLLVQSFAAQARTHSIAHGSIINLGDGSAGWSMSAHYIPYTLSKIGLMALSSLLAMELAPAIRINTIGLGPTLPGSEDEADTFTRLAARAPLKQLSTPEEVCRTIDFLLATPTITGQSILLSSGFHCHRAVDLAG